MKKGKYTTISIPVEMHEELEKIVKNTSFVSVSEFVKNILRGIISSGGLNEEKLTKKEIELVRKRLKKLGYYD